MSAIENLSTALAELRQMKASKSFARKVRTLIEDRAPSHIIHLNVELRTKRGDGGWEVNDAVKAGLLAGLLDVAPNILASIEGEMVDKIREAKERLLIAAAKVQGEGEGE